MTSNFSDLLEVWSRLEPTRCKIDSYDCIHVVARGKLIPAGSISYPDYDAVLGGVIYCMRLKGWSAELNVGPVYAHAKITVRNVPYNYAGEEVEEPAHALLDAYIYALTQNL